MLLVDKNALSQLPLIQNAIIKIIDKDRVVICWKRVLYIQEDVIQLRNTTFYVPRPQDPSLANYYQLQGLISPNSYHDTGPSSSATLLHTRNSFLVKPSLHCIYF